MDCWMQVMKGVAAVVLSFAFGMALGWMCGCENFYTEGDHFCRYDRSVITQMFDFGNAPITAIDYILRKEDK